MLTQAQFRELCSEELGKPYIFGADGPDAYDCSGLAQMLLESRNLDPAGDQTADGLFRYFARPDRGALIELAECDLGDLIFYGTDEAVSHIAIGWGNGDMIEAGGGGRHTTSVEIARAQGAEVRIRPVTRRNDLVAILRPAAGAWAGGATVSSLAFERDTPEFGYYEGTPLTEWLSDGRHMQLKRPYAYYDQEGESWPVPAEAIVDGASIPQPFWPVIGGPFEGRYRDASIIHDYYCDTKTRAWRATHRMFYQAMRCSGVGSTKAKIMYYAVYRLGPRWALAGVEMLTLPEGFEAIAQPDPAPLAPDSFDAGSASADVRTIAQADPDLAEIEALADARAAPAAAPGAPAP